MVNLTLGVLGRTWVHWDCEMECALLDAPRGCRDRNYLIVRDNVDGFYYIRTTNHCAHEDLPCVHRLHRGSREKEGRQLPLPDFWSKRLPPPSFFAHCHGPLSSPEP